MKDARTLAYINLFAVLGAIPYLCELDPEAAKLIEGQQVSIGFAVKGGPEATLFFGGGIVEALVSLLVGALTRFVILFTDKAVRNKILSKFLSSLMATILAYAAHKTGIIAIVDAVIIGNIMTLIPGIGLTNAFRDLFTGDSISGLLRTIEAALTALAIAAGYFIVAFFGGAVL
jgi:uncharacterized membrane protein YjjP (DUF1212 family)